MAYKKPKKRSLKRYRSGGKSVSYHPKTGRLIIHRKKRGK